MGTRTIAKAIFLFHHRGIIRIIVSVVVAGPSHLLSPLPARDVTRSDGEVEVGAMVLGTAALQAGRLDLETIVRAPLVVVADPVVAASGPPATLDELAASIAGQPPGCGGGGVVLLERPAGTILALANPSSNSGLFVWATGTFLAVVADPNRDTRLDPVGELTVGSGRLVAGAPDVIAAWGADVDTGDGSPVRARMHRGRTRLGLIVVAHTPRGQATVAVGAGATSVTYPTNAAFETVPLPLAG